MRHPPTDCALAVREVASDPGPLRALERLRGRACPWLLDSALRSSRLGRFSFAGADPWAVLRTRAGVVELEVLRAARPDLRPGRHVLAGDLFAAARSLLPRLPRRAGPVSLPFVGGAVAALGYELGEQLLPRRLARRSHPGLPAALVLLVDRLLAWDHAEGRCYALGLGLGADAEAARAAAERSVDALLAPAGPAPVALARGAASGPGPTRWFDEGSYGKAVDRIKQEIAAGNVYQANLSQRLEREFAGDAWELYRAVRRRNPAPFACFLELPEVVVVGSSPERFLRVDPDGAVESRPIKGTRARGRHAAEDEARRSALAASAKDRAENLMIVDLVRNDLGRVCEIGSVEVPELMVVEDYASVFQLVSTVTGRLPPGRDCFDLLAACFPPGSMTGAPKLAAMQLLARLEPVPRGLYSGAIGWLDARGGCDLSVVIRSIFLAGGRAHVHAGGGIVADSDPRAEWRESLDKAGPLLAALDELD